MFAYPIHGVDPYASMTVSIFLGSGDDRCRADMGYGIATKYWGQGITTKAVKTALSQVFKD